MSVSRPAVHPVEVTSFAEATAVVNDGGGNDGNNNNNNNNGDDQQNVVHQMLVAQRVRMKDVEGMPGTRGGLLLRLLQFAFALSSLCFMSTTPDFASVTSFRYLVAAVSLQSLWSLVLAFVDAYALLVKRSLRNPHVACLFTIGDGVTSTLTFAAACASAGITVLIGNDFNTCRKNHCGKFEMATAMAFLSWFADSPSFLFNFWTLASR